ncbi:N-acetyltransferase [Streptomyces filamentosus]|uniref:N-acetyltransferase n=1 Tax=Streptomyces filamentosus TaxID=67294 RepID=A0A919BK37_STRFL|nr:GNAT family N-acetyltransferase [Streptomyces filamentosus]GHF97445.1 N-acetyltransferase [Streptomyces filamentosus]
MDEEYGNGGWRLRPGRPGDVEAVAELRAVVLRADLERLGRYDPHRVRQRLRDGFSPAHTSVVETPDRPLAGCVTFRPGPDHFRLEHFYLDPALQGRGLGTAVLRRLLDRADAEGAAVRLDVLRGSPARRLYERAGFVAEAEDGVDVSMVRRPEPPHPPPGCLGLPLPPGPSGPTGLPVPPVPPR